MTSASVKMPQKLCFRLKVQRLRLRRHRLFRRQAALHGAYGAMHPQVECPQRYRANRRAMALALAKMPRRLCILGL